MKPLLLLLWALCAPWLVQAQGPVGVDVINPEGGLVSDLLAGVPFGLQVNGTSLTTNDRVRIVSSTVQCGSTGAEQSAAELLGVPLAGRTPGQDILYAAGVAGPLNDRTLEQQWSSLVLARAGQYRVCYCLALNPPCDAGSKFQHELGVLQVLGPTANYTFSCPVGWPCEVGPIDGNLSAGNQLRLMTSCNPPVGADGFLPGSEYYANATDGLENDPMISTALAGGSRTFFWGSSVVQGMGHSYEVCWCAGGASLNCTQAQDFLVSVGRLDVPGPARPVSVLCAAGRQCRFSVPAQHGVGLGNGDRVLVSQECGTVDTSVVSWPNEGISDPAAEGGQHFQWSAGATGAGVLVNSTIPNGTFVAEPGMYRLCWCHRDTPCSNGSDFRMDVGSLAFAGPSGNRSWVCTRGQRCTLPDIVGTKLSVDDRYLVQHTCGDSSGVEGFEGGASLPDSVQPDPSLNSTAASVTWNKVMTAVGGYKLCWAPAWQRPSNRSCSELSWDGRAAGLASVCAQASPGDGSCGLLSAEAARLRCGTLGARLCLPHELLQGEAAGTPCAAGSPRYWTAQACGTLHRATVAPDQGAAGLSCQAESVAVTQFLTQPATNTLACCADEPTTFSGDAAAYFALPSVYASPAGSVIVRGPFMQDASCVSGEACNVPVRGLQLNTTLDRLLILKYAQSCGNASATTAATDFEQALANSTSASGGSVVFALGKASAFATFPMCWCSMVHSTCTSVPDFNVHVGDLLVGGIDRQTTYCIFSLPCTIELLGTNLGQADAILISPVGEPCGSRLSAVPEVEVNPATMLQRVNTTAKVFVVGVISKLDAFQICYCINLENRACTSGGAPVYEHFSMAAGTIEVRGPRLNVTLSSARAGVPYRLQLTGRLLNRFNRITVLRAGGPACGTFGSNVSDASVEMASSVPVSVYTDGTQEGWDVTIMRSGQFYVCWCSADPCNNATSFGVLAATFPVDGLLDDREPNYPQQIVGNPFPLQFQGVNLLSTDRAVIAPRSAVSRCGDSDTNRHGSFSQNVEGKAPQVILGSTAQATSQLWLNARLVAVGEYLICWCGRSLCTLGSHFNIEAARINITGPRRADFPAATAGEPYRLVVRGTALSPSDRISIVDMSTECGTLPASTLSSTVLDPSGTGAIGPPVETSDAVTAWGGLQIRWQGLYKVCWAGNFSFSRLCLATDASGQCSQFESAYYPYHIGDLAVDYGHISLVGQTSIVRCGSLDVMAVPPQLTPRLTVDYAAWECAPRETEICDSLHYDFLDTRAPNHLSLHIPASTISSSLDRARFWASGRGEDASVHNISMTITMIDIQNITRQGYLAIQIFAQRPLVVGSPSDVRITTDDRLYLAVYVKLPGGDFCQDGAGGPTMPSGASISWRLLTGTADLAANNTASSPHHLLLEPAAVMELGVGAHIIAARADFGGQYPPQDVTFSVFVLEGRLQPPILAAPDAVPDGCPAAFGTETSHAGSEGEAALAYGWTCSGPQGGACSNFTSVSTIRQVHVFNVGSGAAGVHRVRLLVEDSDGGTAQTEANVDVTLGALPGGRWPVAVLPLPEALRAERPVACAATALRASQSLPSHCAPPADAVWSLVNLTGSNVSSDDTVDEGDLDIANGTGFSLYLNTQRALQAADGYPVVTFVGIVPSSMLAPGGMYRCVLRVGDVVLGSTSNFRIGDVPKLGWITVAPRSGTALQTQFTLDSTGWLAEHLPLRHAFFAVPGPAPPVAAAVDAARFLRGWGLETGAMAVLGIAGPRVSVVARVRDTLGSSAQASAEIQVAPAVGTAAAVAALGSAWWPPDPRAAVATAASLVLAVMPDRGFADHINATAPPAQSQAAATATIVSALIDALHAAAGPTPGGEPSREDLGLEVWVLERTLQLAVANSGTASFLNASSSLKAAAVLARAAARSATAPPEPATASRFVAAASVLVTEGAISMEQSQATELLRSVRGAERDLGNALYVGMQQGAVPGGPHFASDLALERTATPNMSLVVGWAASDTAAAGVDVPAEGLQLRLPALAQRRLSAGGAAITCTAGDVRVQLTRWPRSPVSPPPLAPNVRFEGPLQGLRVASAAEAGDMPEIAGLRLWGCTAAAWQAASIVVSFFPQVGAAGRSFEVAARNGSDIMTSRVEVSWSCMQWDGSLGIWRALPAMTASVNSTAVSCTSLFNPDASSVATSGAAVAEDGYVFLAALPVARSVWLSSVPAEPPPPEKPRELFFWRLWGLGVAVLVAQTLLLGFLAFSRPVEAQAQQVETPAAATESVTRRPTLSVLSVQRGVSSLGSRARRWCVLVPAFWLLDGLWHVRPWRLFSWAACSFRRRPTSISLMQVGESSALSVQERSIPAMVLRDAELSLNSEPALRGSVLVLAKEAIASAERVHRQRVAVAELGQVAGCCGLALFDARECHFRGLLSRAFDMYRDLKLGADNVMTLEKMKSLRSSGGRGERSSMHFFGSRSSVDSQEANEQEALALSIVHHVQQEVLRLALGEERIELSARERDMLSCYQEALRKEMMDKPPLETPLLISAFSPPVAVPVQLLSIGSGDEYEKKPGGGLKPGAASRSPAGSRSPVEPASRGSSRGSKRPAAAPAAAAGGKGFAGVLPVPDGQAPAAAWTDASGGVAPKAEREAEDQPYVLGAMYFMWLHGRKLHIHRAASAMYNRKTPPEALDSMLAIHEVTRTYLLGDDVQELGTATLDDRILVLRLRRGQRLRWRVRGEVRMWAATPQGPLPGADSGGDILQEVIHNNNGTGLQCDDPSIFFYRLGHAPHTANSIHLETTSRKLAHAYTWYSHGGAAISFAFSSSDQLRQNERPLPGVPGEADRPQELVQAFGVYTSDILSLQHILRPVSDETHSSYYQTVMTLRDHRKLRLCFTTRFARLGCQSSVLSMRDMVFPDAAPVEIEGHGSMVTTASAFHKPSDSPPVSPSAREEPKVVSAYDLPGDVPEWRGLRGSLELRLLSASQLGLTDPQSSALAVAGKALGAPPPPKPRGRTGMPSPRVFAYVQTQPPPAALECRKTVELPERTANPIWNSTWQFTAEYSEEDPPPGDLRFEVWDCAGQDEFLGEVLVPFPRGSRVRQYHLPLRPSYARMAPGETRHVNGTLSFQLRWLGAREVEPPAAELLPIPPSPVLSVCGTLGITLIKGVDLRSADFLSSDPYCVVHVSTSPKIVSSWRTETIFGTRNPLWEELHEFHINWPQFDFASAPVVKVEIWDYDHFSSDEFLGEASFQLPCNEGHDVLDLELFPNRSKGAAMVKGRLNIRLFYRDEFHQEAAADTELSPYEQAFCTYFGTRPVDDQFARAMAPSLTFFHFSFGRLLRGQCRRAWHIATCGLVDPGPRRVGGAQARISGYFALSAALWSSLAVAGGILADWSSAGAGLSLAAGGLVGLLLPDLAHILAQLVWHDPRPPPMVGIEAWEARGAGDPPIFAVVVLILGLVGVAAGLVLGDKEADLRIALAAAALLVVRLLAVPLVHGLSVASALHWFKRSSMFDWIVRYCPSMLTAHTAAF